MTPNKQILKEIYQNLQEICEEDDIRKSQVEMLNCPGESFCSTIYRMRVVLKNNTQPSSLIIKILSRANFKGLLEDQFRNECFMYKKCLPEVFPTEVDLFPRVHLLKDNIVVLDDISDNGYKLGPKSHLDIDHLKLAIKSLARLHASSLAYKILNQKQFREIGSKLYNIKLLLKHLQRGREELGMDGVRLYLEKYPEKVKDAGIENLKNVFRNLSEPIDNNCGECEPWMVLCHGDFNRNNILFKYGPDGRNPIDVKFIDLQTSRVCSPIVDLSTILWINTNQATRQEYQDDLINMYFEIIEKRIRPLDMEGIYSRESFDKEFQARVFYGWMIGCDFLRISLEPYESMKNMNFNIHGDYWEMIKKFGGKEADERVIDIIRQFIDKEYWPIKTIK